MRKIITLLIILASSGFNAYSACEIPTSLSTTSITPTTAQLNWGAVAGTNIEYRVRYRRDLENPWTYLTDLSTNSVVISGLIQGTAYQWEVTTECNLANTSFSGYSSRKFFSTGIDYTCVAPANPSTSSITQTTATFSWNAIVGTGVEYIVRYRRDIQNEWTYVTDITSNSVNISGLISGTAYQWEVATECNVSNTSYSNYGTRRYFTTAAAYSCSIPQNPVTTSKTSTTAKLSWEDVAGLGPEYMVRYRRNIQNNWTYVQNITSNTVDISSLIPGTGYQWEVTTECNVANTSFSGYSVRRYFTTNSDYSCVVPNNPTTSSITATTATFSWAAIAGTGVEYIVRYRKSSQNNWTYLTNLKSNSVTVSGLTSGRIEYQWEVATECNVANTSYSNYSVRKFFKTNIDYTCVAPSNPSVSSITSTSATLNWDAISGTGVEYVVRYRRDIDNPWTYIYNNTANSLTVNSLTSGMKYSIQVATECSVDNTVASNFGDNKIFYTNTAVDCDGIEPTMSIVADTGFTTARLSWSDMGAPMYELRYRAVGDASYNVVSTFDTTALLASLTQNTAYEYYLKSICSSNYVQNESNNTGLFNFTTRTCVRPQSGFQVSSIENTSADITWGEVDGVEGYVLWYAVKGSPELIYEFVETNTISLSSLYSGTIYRYEVQSVCNAVDGLYSTFSTSPVGNRHQFTTTGSTSCVPPSGLNVTGFSDNSVSLSWSPNGSVSYNLSIKASFETNWVTVDPADAISTHMYSELLSGQSYAFRVQSVCSVSGDLVSDWSSRVDQSTSGSNQCPTPSNILVSNKTSSGAAISWGNSLGATSYGVRYKKAVGSNSWTYITGLVSPFVELNGLAASTAYTSQIYSYCNSEEVPESVVSDYINFTTLPPARTSDVSIKSDLISVYPNPVNDLLNIEVVDEQNATLNIYSSNGVLIYTDNVLGNQANSINVSSFTPGVYFVKLMMNREVYVTKFTKK